MIIGKTAAIELPIQYRPDPNGGWRTIRRFRGTYKSLLNLMVVLAAGGGLCNLDHESMEYYLLTADIPGLIANGGTIPNPNSLVTTVWGVDNNLDSRDVFQSPLVATEMLKVTDVGERAQLKADFEAVTRGEAFTFSFTDPLHRPKPLIYSDVQARMKAKGMNLTVMDALMGAMARGATQYRWNFPVIRKRLIYPPSANVTIDFSPTNQIWTPNTLLAKEPTMPKRYQNAVRATKGFWAVGATVDDQEAQDRCQFTVEYQLIDLWEEFFYGKAL